jgi:hypothetical protein
VTGACKFGRQTALWGVGLCGDHVRRPARRSERVIEMAQRQALRRIG